MVETACYQEISLLTERKGRCPVCGKWMTLRWAFRSVRSPANRGVDGHVLTSEEILARLRAQAQTWHPHFLHAKCRAPRGELR